MRDASPPPPTNTHTHTQTHTHKHYIRLGDLGVEFLMHFQRGLWSVSFIGITVFGVEIRLAATGNMGLYVHRNLIRGGEVGGSGIFISNTYSLHCHHQNDFAFRWAAA